MADLTLYGWCYFVSVIRGYRIEPMTDTWISLSTLTETYELSERFLDLVNDPDIVGMRTPEQSDVDYRFAVFTNVYQIASELKVSSLITMKYNGCYTYYICNPLLGDSPPISIEYELSDKWFLNIEYHHPNIRRPIDITLSRNHFLLNNEILSSVFIKRALEYQSASYIFDMNYIVRVMDNNINIFYLKAGEFSSIVAGEPTTDFVYDEINPSEGT